MDLVWRLGNALLKRGVDFAIGYSALTWYHDGHMFWASFCLMCLACPWFDEGLQGRK